MTTNATTAIGLTRAPHNIPNLTTTTNTGGRIPTAAANPATRTTPPASYATLVGIQKERNPCIANLAEFLRTQHLNSSCRIEVLDFKDPGSQNPQGPITKAARTLPSEDLDAELNSNTPKDLLGRIFLIEDLTSDVVKSLGLKLAIDPLFFASHLDTPSQDIGIQAPDKVTLPSRTKNKGYFNIHYHRTIEFTSRLHDDYQTLLRKTTIRRKVTILTSIKDKRIGLAQHCVSVWQKTLPGKGWIALILSDPKMDGKYRDQPSSVSHHAKLFAGGYEDFLTPPFAHSIPQTYRENLLDDLLYYFEAAGHGFNERDPSLISLARYPLQVVAREWANYISVMSHSVKQYEYDSKDFRNKSIEIDLKELQRWRRRTMASEQKIEACTKFIKHSRSLESRANQAQWDDLLEDWVYVGRNLRSCGRTLEAMVSVTQIVDARRSVEETQETTKLTTLALVFVPMSLFASILSMNNDFAVGKKHFYVYWAVAVPVSAILFAGMRPESMQKRLNQVKALFS